MLEIKGSKTEENLKKAFMNESEGTNKYTYYAEQAEKDGYGQISNIFYEIAENEREHAALWYKLLNGGMNTTEENLADSINSEQKEADETYLNFAETARQEGLDEIAELLEKVAVIENKHNEVFKELLNEIRMGTVFKKDGEKEWKCMKCGYRQVGNNAPERCPVCGRGQSCFVEEEIS